MDVLDDQHPARRVAGHRHPDHLAGRHQTQFGQRRGVVPGVLGAAVAPAAGDDDVAGPADRPATAVQPAELHQGGRSGVAHAPVADQLAHPPPAVGRVDRAGRVGRRVRHGVGRHRQLVEQGQLRPQVGRGQPVEGDVPARRQGRQPGRLIVDHRLEQLAGDPAVAERRALRHPLEVAGHGVLGVVGQLVVVLGAQVRRDGDQLVDRVVRELDGPGEPGGQAGVGVEEPPHQLRVAGDDDDQLVAVVLHHLHQRVDGLLPEVGPGAARAGGERVRLVDEQGPTQRPGDQLGGLDRGRPDVLPDQVRPGRLDQVPLGQDAELGQDRAVEPGHRGLAGARRAGEGEVPAHRRHRQAHPRASRRRSGHDRLVASSGQFIAGTLRFPHSIESRM